MQKWIIPALLFVTQLVQAQTKVEWNKQRTMDSITMARVAEIAKIYPLLRQVTVSNDFVLKRNSNTDFNKESAFSSELVTNRTRVNINLPLYTWNRNVLKLGLNYMHQYQRYGNLQPAVRPGSKQEDEIAVSSNTYGFSLNYGRNDSLFNLPVIYSLGVAGVTSTFSSIQKMSYTGGVIFTLKRTPVTALSVGGVIIIDPSLSFPFTPVVSYYHRFQIPKLELLIDIPYRAMLRKQFNKKSWATAGTEISSSVSFLNLSQYGLPVSTNYSSFELKSGLTYEYELAPKIIAGIGAGVFSTMSSRMFKATDQAKDYFVRDKTRPAPYLNISISILPFARSLIR
jgi:hypothetical protein